MEKNKQINNKNTPFFQQDYHPHAASFDNHHAKVYRKQSYYSINLAPEYYCFSPSHSLYSPSLYGFYIYDLFLFPRHKSGFLIFSGCDFKALCVYDL